MLIVRFIRSMTQTAIGLPYRFGLLQALTQMNVTINTILKRQLIKDMSSDVISSPDSVKTADV